MVDLRLSPRSIEEILPLELWDRILQAYRHDFGEYVMPNYYDIMTVSKSWAVSGW
jgi:hypothetical protein